MSKRRPAPVVMTVAQAAPAFGLTVNSVRHYIAAGAPARGDRIEVGAFAAFLARSTMAASHVAA
jgi:hypothetical protein